MFSPMKGHTLSVNPDLFDHGAYPHISEGADARLYVNVIRTSEQGTLAALRSAAKLSKDLCGQIVLLAPEIVPFHFALERPHVPAWFLQLRLYLLAGKAEILDEDFEIRVHMCRSRRAFLSQALAPHSLIVIGAESRGWNLRNRRLVRWLRAQRHQVITVPADRRKPSPSKLDRGRLAQYLRVRQIEELHEAFH
jgi:hypothetical protein